MAPKILIVDDEEGIRFSLRGILEDEGYEVEDAQSGEEGLKKFSVSPPGLVFLDIWLPGMDGLAVLEAMREASPDIPVVMISGHGNIETAVSAIKKGAFDFIEKPLSLEKVVITAAKALEFFKLRQENIELRARIDTSQTRRLTGKTKAIQLLYGQIERVAPHGRLGTHHRRQRNRQGNRRPHDPRAKPPGGKTHGGGQLRGHTGRTH